MVRKQGALARARLYVILDREVCDYPRLFEILKQAVGAGVGVVQLRDKISSSREILTFARYAVAHLKDKIPFIINDRVDLAMASGAAGVHLGHDDLPIADARKIMGPKAVIGVSCQTLAYARLAQKEGADYIGWGSVFKTLTKPDRRPLDLPALSKDIGKIHIPVFAIGGIDLTNVRQLTGVGIKRIAVTRAICLSKSVRKTVGQFYEYLGGV